jgi:hypothetical protein
MEEHGGLVLQAMLDLGMELYEDVRKARDRKVGRNLLAESSDSIVP